MPIDNHLYSKRIIYTEKRVFVQAFCASYPNIIKRSLTYFHDPHKKLYFPIAHPLGRKGGIFLRHQLLPFGFKKIPKAKKGLLWINLMVTVDIMRAYDSDVKSHA